MRKFRPTHVACALALALAAGTASAQFTNTYVFGDSVFDAGQYGSRFTTNPGLVPSMYVGQNWGLTVTPSFQGGNSYAQGGALINAPQGNLPPGVPDLSVTQQVNLYLSKGFADPRALYQIDGGGNDLFTQFTAFATGKITQAQMQANVSQAAVDLATAVGKLKAAGAQYVIVFNLPDAGKSPAAAPFGPQAQAGLTQLSQLFNSTLNQAMTQGNLQVIQFNAFALMTEIIAQPGKFGMVNVKDAACTTTDVLQCNSSTLVATNANMNYFFADGKHSTTGTYVIVADAMESMITGPQEMAALGQAPADVERATWRALDGRMMSAINAPGTGGRMQTWAAYDYGNADIFGAGVSGNGDLNTISVGADMVFSDKLLAGVQFSYTEYDGDFGGGTGDFKLREPMLTAYTGFGGGPWYVGATLGLASLDFSTTRNIVLGPTTRSESGSTRGYHTIGRLLGGYWFKFRDVDHGPFAKLTYEKIIVRQFSENGNDSTALTFGQQKNDFTWSSVGWQATGNFSGFRPFARATWEYNFNAEDKQVSAKPNTLSTWYTVPGFEQDDNWWLFDVGVSRDFGKVTGFLSGNASASKGDGNYWGLTLGIRVPL